MYKKLGFAVIMLTTIVSASLFTECVYGKGFGEQGMVSRLDLSKEQKENIEVKEAAIEKELMPLKDAIRNNRNLLNAELSSENPDNTKINGLIDSISNNMTDIQKKKMFLMLWMREQLTPEQKRKLQSLIKSRQNNSEETGVY